MLSQKPRSESSPVADPPKLMFKALMPNAAWLETAKFNPERMSESKVNPSQPENTLTATILASGATPRGDATMEATDVPCPSQS